MKNARPPRDNLFRAVFPGVELRAADGEESGPVMTGHFAVTNQWTRINSIFEGEFLERFAPGAFRKTIKDGRDSMRVLFQHGRDPQVGNKPLGPIRELREDDQGAYYEVDLLDAGYVRNEILPGLEQDLYGASFRFRVIKEEINEKPRRSTHNPDGITERTIKEAEVIEFGPVTFPAYAGASAGVRSLTDEFLRAELLTDPEKVRDLLDAGLVLGRSADGGSGSGADDAAGTDDDNDLGSGRAEGDTGPGGSGDAAGPDDAGDRDGGNDDALPVTGAEPEAHSGRGSRAPAGRLYGDDAAPNWRL